MVGFSKSGHLYRIVKIYYQSFNFAKFAILNALAKLKLAYILDP